jgi:hypothetical protein
LRVRSRSRPCPTHGRAPGSLAAPSQVHRMAHLAAEQRFFRDRVSGWRPGCGALAAGPCPAGGARTRGPSPVTTSERLGARAPDCCTKRPPHRRRRAVAARRLAAPSAPAAANAPGCAAAGAWPAVEGRAVVRHWRPAGTFPETLRWLLGRRALVTSRGGARRSFQIPEDSSHGSLHPGHQDDG